MTIYTNDVWPDEHDYSKLWAVAPSGATHYDPAIKVKWRWVKDVDGDQCMIWLPTIEEWSSGFLKRNQEALIEIPERERVKNWLADQEQWPRLSFMFNNHKWFTFNSYVERHIGRESIEVIHRAAVEKRRQQRIEAGLIDGEQVEADTKLDHDMQKALAENQWDLYETDGNQEDDGVAAPLGGKTAKMAEAESLTEDKTWYPDRCPVTFRPFFMAIEHPEKGFVPTYGGPFDSYTIPEPSNIPETGNAEFHDIELVCQRYDHDEGGWLIDEYECVNQRVTTEDRLMDWGAWDDEEEQLSKAEPAEWDGKSKPPWSVAPKEANWLCQDLDGSWGFWESKPHGPLHIDENSSDEEKLEAYEDALDSICMNGLYWTGSLPCADWNAENEVKTPIDFKMPIDQTLEARPETPEQKAERERAVEIQKMYEIAQSLPQPTNPNSDLKAVLRENDENVVTALYDAGYRLKSEGKV